MGSSSDPENDPLTYIWIVPAEITLINPTSDAPSFQAPMVPIDTDYSIKLKVNDGELDSPEDEVIIRVLHNQLPVANAGADFSVDEGSNVSLDGSASSDPEGSPLTYKWTAPAGIILSSNTTAKPSFTAPEVAQDTQFQFSLIVNDGTNDSPADQVIVTVKQLNKAPIANAGPDRSVNEGTTVSLDGTGSSDPDNDQLKYTWTAPEGITLSSNKIANPTFLAPNVAKDTDLTFKLTVIDGSIISAPDFVVITVKNVNQKPVANAGTDQTVNEGALVALDGSASSDFDQDALTYLWTVPAGITLSSATAAKPSFTAPEVQADKNYTFTLIVNDGKDNSQSYEIIVTVKQVNKAPVANAGPDQSVNENSLYTLDGSASTDPDGDALTYKWTAPAGVSLSSTTIAEPTFTTPDVNANTNYTFSLVVNDGKVDSPADQVVITVKQVNKAPIADAGPNQTVDEGALVTLNGSASSDPDNDPLTYKWTAPSGIVLNSTTTSKPTFTAPEVLSDTDFALTLTVNDGTENSNTDEVVITVKQVNKAPVYTGQKSFVVKEDEPFELNITWTDEDAANTKISADNLPYGLLVKLTSLNSAVISGVFTNEYVGVHDFTLTFSDGVLESRETITLTVLNTDDSPYVKNPMSDISVDKRSPDQIIDLSTVFADDDIGDVLTFSITSNTNEQVVHVSISGTNLVLSFSTENVGLSEVAITAISNGKEVKSVFKVEVKIPTGIELIDDAGIQIYPNPTKGNVQLNFSNTPKAGTRITVYDISGKVISKSLADNKQEYLNLNGNPAGLYFIKIDQKTSKTYKLILE